MIYAVIEVNSVWMIMMAFLSAALQFLGAPHFFQNDHFIQVNKKKL